MGYALSYSFLTRAVLSKYFIFMGAACKSKVQSQHLVHTSKAKTL